MNSTPQTSGGSSVAAACSSSGGGNGDGNASPGASGKKVDVTLQLQWVTQAQFAGYIAALAAIPIVALAPLLNDMYSPLSPLPRREVVAISAFVPIFFNVLRGLSQLTPVHRELMRSYAASGTAVLRTIRIPGALPHFFTGLRIASSLAVIAAVVSEYFGGLQDGLGSRITSSVGATDYPAAWASVVGAVVLGLLFYIGALLLERATLGRRAAPAS